MTLPTLAQVRKAVVNVVGVASMAVASGYLHGRVLLDVEAGIAAVTAVLHYLVPNAPAAAGLGDPVFAPDPTAPTTAPPAVPPGS